MLYFKTILLIIRFLYFVGLIIDIYWTYLKLIRNNWTYNQIFNCYWTKGGKKEFLMQKFL